MSKQIAVRLSEETVDFIDKLVAQGRASSRAAVVAKGVDLVRRQETAARDVAILIEMGDYPGFDELANFSTRTPMDELD